MADPLSITASAISVLHVVKRIYDVGNAAYKSKREKGEFNRVMNSLTVQMSSLKALAERVEDNPEDERFAGLRAIFTSSKQVKNGGEVVPDLTKKEPGVLERLQFSMDDMESKLVSRSGCRGYSRRLLWIHEKKVFQENIAEIKQWTDTVDSVLQKDHLIVDLETNDHVKVTSARVKKLEEEAGKAAEDRKIASEERRQDQERKQMKANESRRREIFKWISPLNFGQRQSALLNQPLSSFTKPRLLESEEFMLWTKGRPWILHCEGKPGAGKTMLCALVGDHLASMFEKEDRDIPILFLYLDHKERGIQSLDSLIASLLKQFLQREGASFRSAEAQRLYQGDGRPKPSVFYEALCAEIGRYERVVVIVDALDEASPGDAPRLLANLHGLPNDKTSIMVTSQRTEDGPRPTYQVECDRCGEWPTKAYYRCHICKDGSFYLCQTCMDKGDYCEDRGHDLTQPREVLMSVEPSGDEIKHYIQAEFHAELKLGVSEDGDYRPSTFGSTQLGRLIHDKPMLQEEITDIVVAKADGMFALAQLYMSSFKNLWLTEPEIMEMLEHPPEGYTEFYEQHMDRINAGDLGAIGSSLGMRVLLWVVCTSRPLKFSELQDALAVNFKRLGLFTPSARQDKASIIRATAGLVTIDNSDDATVRLNHGTARQYFENNRDRFFPHASAYITRVTLHYLSLKELSSPGEGEWEDKEFEMREIDFPFLDYAYQYWGTHAGEAKSDLDAQAAVLKFVSDETRIASVTQAMWYLPSETWANWDVRKGANGLHVCAWFGLTFAVSNLLDQGMEINSCDPQFGQTPLMYACRRGHTETATVLLDLGARVNMISNRGSSALFEAVIAGYVEVLKILLAKGKVQINAQHSGRSNQTALMIAARKGDIELVKALIDHCDIDVNQQDVYGNTALSHAILMKKPAVATYLVDQRVRTVELDSVNWTKSSALILAASRGQDDVVEKLLSKGAKYSIKDKEGGGTAILRAVDEGHVSTIEIMLKHDVDVDCLDEQNRGLLHGAAISGHVEVLRLLLKKDLDINAIDKKGKTPLHDASRNGNIETSQLLLACGANASLTDNSGRTPWLVAWQNGRTSVMKVLDGDDPYELTEFDLQGIVPNASSLPVWSLAKLGYTDLIAQAIITRKPEIFFLDPDTGDTALSFAVLSAQPEIVEILLKAGMSAAATNDNYRTPLHFAALTGSIAIISLLLESYKVSDNAEAVNAPDFWGSSPLLLADSNNHTECCLLLIEAGATVPSAKASMKQSLFFSAIEFGNLEAVVRLVHMGADVQMKDVLGSTGLQIAKSRGNIHVERFLRKSKSSKVQGMRMGMGLGMDFGVEKEEVVHATAFEESPVELSSQANTFHEPVASSILSVAERFKALDIPQDRPRWTSAKDCLNKAEVKPRSAPQLAS